MNHSVKYHVNNQCLPLYQYGLALWPVMLATGLDASQTQHQQRKRVNLVSQCYEICKDFPQNERYLIFSLCLVYHIEAFY